MRIKFKASGFCSAVGNFAPGDFAILSDEMARHLVEEACAAEYAEVAVAEDSPVIETKKTKVRSK